MTELFTIQSIDRHIYTKNFGGYEDRNYSMIKLFSKAINQANLINSKPIIVSTSDAPKYLEDNAIYNFSTINDNYDYVCPDFLFDCWTSTGIDDYESSRKSISKKGEINPKSNIIGWIGSLTGDIRKSLYLKYSEKPSINLDFRVTNLIKDSNGVCIANNFMSLEQQIEEWKYLLDIEGNGYSARLKLLLCSNRIVFIADRPYKEFFYQFLIPWTHYIPVKRDLSDLEINYSIIENDTNLQNYIKQNSKIFCDTYLTRNFAIQYLANLLLKN